MQFSCLKDITLWYHMKKVTDLFLYCKDEITKMFFLNPSFLLDLTMSVYYCIAEVYYGPPQTNGFSCTHNWRPHVFFIGPSTEIKCEVPKIIISPHKKWDYMLKKYVTCLWATACMCWCTLASSSLPAKKRNVRIFEKKDSTILSNTF